MINDGFKKNYTSFQLCDRSTNPQWNESFYFIVHDPKQQILVVKARHLFTLDILHACCGLMDGLGASGSFAYV